MTVSLKSINCLDEYYKKGARFDANRVPFRSAYQLIVHMLTNMCQETSVAKAQLDSCARRCAKRLTHNKVKICFHQKLATYQNELKPHLSPWQEYSSFYLLFLNWATDLIELYHLQNPEDEAIKTLEDELILKIINLQYKLDYKSCQKELEECMQLLFAKLILAAPDTEKFCNLWKSFSVLLFDHCDHANHWSIDIKPNELSFYLSPKFIPDSIDLENTEFVECLAPEEFLRLYNHSAKLARGNWLRIVPLLKNYCEKASKEQIKQAREKLAPADAQYVIRSWIGWLQSTRVFLEGFQPKILSELDAFSNVDLHNLDSEQLSINAILNFLEKYTDQLYFPPCPTISKVLSRFDRVKLATLPLADRNIAWKLVLARVNPPLVFENTDAVISFIEEKSNTVVHAHWMLYSFIVNIFSSFCEIHESGKHFAKKWKEEVEMRENARAIQELKMKKKAFAHPVVKQSSVETPAPEVTSSHAFTKAVEESRKEVQALVTVQKKIKRAKPVIKKLPPKEAPKQTVAAEVAPKAESVASEPASTRVRFANAQHKDPLLRSHADLYSDLVKACQTLSDRYADQPRHALNLHRVGYQAGALLSELTLRVLAVSQTDEPDISTSHNLWVHWRKTNIPETKATVSRLYGASFWVRFTHEQERSWNQLHFNIHTKPEVFVNLIALSNGLDSRSTLTTDLSNVLSDTYLVAERLNCLEKYNLTSVPSIPQGEDDSVEELESLVDQVVELSQKFPHNDVNPWIKQWKDDLNCLVSTIELLNSELSLEEYALLMSHASFLLHACIQSPLYAIRELKGLEATHEHDLIKLWENTMGNMKVDSKELIVTWTLHTSGTSRYPFTLDKPYSKMHRLQLEAIAMLKKPEVLEGFMLAEPQCGESGFVPSMDCPYLKKMTLPPQQREILINGIKEISQLLSTELVPQIKG